MRRPCWWSRRRLDRELPNQGTRSAPAGDLRRCRAAAAPGRGTGGRPPSPGREESPGQSILHRATRCSAGQRCSHQRQRAAQAGGLGVRTQGGGARLVGRKGGTSPKAMTTSQVSAPTHVCLGASRHVLHRTHGFSLGESGRACPAPFPRTQRCSESGCARANMHRAFHRGERWRPLSPGLGRPYSTSLACPNPPLSELVDTSRDTRAPFRRGFPFR
jgi:hypothetical protein